MHGKKRTITVIRFEYMDGKNAHHRHVASTYILILCGAKKTRIFQKLLFSEPNACARTHETKAKLKLYMLLMYLLYTFIFSVKKNNNGKMQKKNALLHV